MAKALIVKDDVDLMLLDSTPETTNPVCAICESEKKPVISSVASWQPWCIGQQGNPNDPKSWKAFDYAYHFFWGMEDVIGVFPNLWGQLRICEVIDAGADVAILAREPAGIPNTVVQRIGSVERVLSATAGYLALHGVPRSPSDLLDHHMAASDGPRVLRLSQGSVEEIVRVPAVVRSNEDQVIRAATLAGAGISDLPLYVVHEEIRRGSLVPLLADWHLPPSTMNVVFRDKRSVPARVRAFVEFLVESIHADAEAGSLWTGLPRCARDDQAITEARYA